MANAKQFPLNHVAVSVPDVLAAAKWYEEVLGFQSLQPPMIMDRAQSPDHIAFKLYPGDIDRITMCAMSSSNGVGLELFQFEGSGVDKGGVKRANFEDDCKRGGFFHMAVTTPDLEAVCADVLDKGGKMIGQKVPAWEYEAAYVKDPWGNVVELISASFERVMANRV